MYGNEEGGEFAGENGGQEPSKVDDDKTDSIDAPQTAPSFKPEEKSPVLAKASVPPPPISGAPIQSYTTPLPSDPKPPYVQQGTQHIPTYQQPSDYEAHDGGQQQDGYGSERSVRPSEMKDEG